MDAPCHKKLLKELKLDNMMPYITEENLLAAQTNIIDANNYNNEVSSKVTRDSNSLDNDNRQMYSSQGLNNNNSHIRGYDINNVYLGSLNYEIL
jgi:hypothetical protein